MPGGSAVPRTVLPAAGPSGAAAHAVMVAPVAAGPSIASAVPAAAVPPSAQAQPVAQAQAPPRAAQGNPWGKPSTVVPPPVGAAPRPFPAAAAAVAAAASAAPRPITPGFAAAAGGAMPQGRSPGNPFAPAAARTPVSSITSASTTTVIGGTAPAPQQPFPGSVGPPGGLAVAGVVDTTPLPIGCVPSGMPVLTAAMEDASGIPLLLRATVTVSYQPNDGPSSSYVKYCVETKATWNHKPGTPSDVMTGQPPIDSTTSVLRRYSDFDWLYHRLVSTIPMSFIPLLPPKVRPLVTVAGDWLGEILRVCRTFAFMVDHALRCCRRSVA